MASRQFPDWVNEFVRSTDHTTSPELYRRWAAIAAIAGALERKVWVRTYGSELYPNLYTVLIGIPGVGKSEMTWRVRKLWQSLPQSHVASANVSRASLADELNEAVCAQIKPLEKIHLEYNSLLLCNDELSVLLPQYDIEFMAALTDLYDCRVYTEKKRSRSIEINIERAQLNLFTATQPATLNNFLPDNAWDQGFLSRVLLIYSGEVVRKSLFLEQGDKSMEELTTDLRTIANVTGKFTFKQDAAEFIDTWHMSGGRPRPDHPKLYNYCTRRTAHLLKLSMIASISENNDLIITKEHIQRALDWMVEAEESMPDIFKSMSSGGDSGIMKDVWHFVYDTYIRTGKTPVPRSRVIGFLSERADSYKVTHILEVMESAKIITVAPGKGGVSGYKPKMKGTD